MVESSNFKKSTKFLLTCERERERERDSNKQKQSETNIVKNFHGFDKKDLSEKRA